MWLQIWQHRKAQGHTFAKVSTVPHLVSLPHLRGRTRLIGKGRIGFAWCESVLYKGMSFIGSIVVLELSVPYLLWGHVISRCCLGAWAINVTFVCGQYIPVRNGCTAVVPTLQEPPLQCGIAAVNQRLYVVLTLDSGAK
jgi:hypothetical protein